MMRSIFILALVIFAGCEKESTPVDRTLGAARIIVANAGPDIEIELPLSFPVKLNSSQSINFGSSEWRKISGPECLPFDSVLYSDTDLALWLPGNYSFELTVRYHSSLSKDTVNILAKSSSTCGDVPEQILIQSKDVTAFDIPFSTSVFLTAEDKVAGYDMDFYYNPYEPRKIAIYDIPTKKLELHTLNTDAIQMCVANTNEAFYMAGGGSENNLDAYFYSDKVFIYDKNSRVWSQAKLSEAREQATGISAGDQIFFAGGYNTAGFSASVDIYNQQTKKWNTALLSEARVNILALTDGQKVYFAGGTSISGPSLKIDIYDIATGQWSVEQLSARYENLKGFFADNKLYFAGNVQEGPLGKSVVEIKDLNGHNLGTSCLPAGVSNENQQTALSTDQFIVVPGFALNATSMINLFDKKTAKWKLLVPKKPVSNTSFTSENLITYNNKIYGLITSDFWDEDAQYLFTIDF